ncbi:hypothetical protein KKI90_20510 [Xenorhabdus bovienii]|uniref:hypothetical protein n=2 Tax=Xenorhabdus bovienii TaxID=40576 RepID=UPI00237D070D|nr:hypothetical protein [Xenorhabdus bovienii]MDE1487015.1 hypothetical protein [Xenorhabdus bovienii]MDE9479535.1 hypothetical protein [Xenorhabdus bovienii]MDE9532222.1 hypothetical protein [Xenorhabdus bovienii]
MKEQFEIKITVEKNEEGELTLNAKSNLVDSRNPSVYFAALCMALKKQILPTLESKLELADEIADLVKRTTECSCDEDD